MSKINNLNEAILNIGKTRKNKYGDAKTNDILYSRWDKWYSKTIGDFYHDFIKPRLPHPDIIREWHKMLMEYCEMDGAIFPIRDGHTNAPDDKIKLRRGWLVRVDWDVAYDKKFSYTFTDNYFPAYIYKMALDGYCPTAKEFFDFMTETKYPEDIAWLKSRNVENPISDQGQKRKFFEMPIRFGQFGKTSYPGNTEAQKNAYINTSPAPSCDFGTYGYKHAHVFSVKGNESKNKDSKIQNELYNIGGKDVQWKNIGLVELGEESHTKQDYTWDDEINNYSWRRTMKDSGEREELRKVVIAHFLRFCDPMNHFLSPMQGSNKFTKKNRDYSLDIGEYENLLSYLIFLREREFGKDYEDFKKAILAPIGMKSVDCSSEVINVIYHEDKQTAANKKSKAASSSHPSTKTKSSRKTPAGKIGIKSSMKVIDLSNINYAYLDTFKVGEIAQQVLGAILKSGKVSKADVDAFKTETETKKTFGFGNSLLSPVMIRTSNVNRYYADSYTLYGERLYLYNQWQKTHKERLIKWILDWISVNGGKI